MLIESVNAAYFTVLGMRKYFFALRIKIRLVLIVSSVEKVDTQLTEQKAANGKKTDAIY